MRKSWKKLSYANVIATLALFVALGGGAYAATQLPKNSVGAKQLKSGAVTPPKLSKAAQQTLTGKPGEKGAKGDPGPKGDPGAKGDTGPSDAYASRLSAGVTIPKLSEEELMSLELPAGSYVIQSKVTAYALESAMSYHCYLRENGILFDESVVAGANATATAIVNQGAVTLQSAGLVNLTCVGEGVGAEWEIESSGSLIATKVGTLHAPN